MPTKGLDLYKIEPLYSGYCIDKNMEKGDEIRLICKNEVKPTIHRYEGRSATAEPKYTRDYFTCLDCKSTFAYRPEMVDLIRQKKTGRKSFNG